MKVVTFFILASGRMVLSLIIEGRTFIAVYCLPQAYVQLLLRDAASTSVWALSKHPCFGSSQPYLHLFIYLFDLAYLSKLLTRKCPQTCCESLLRFFRRVNFALDELEMYGNKLKFTLTPHIPSCLLPPAGAVHVLECSRHT